MQLEFKHIAPYLPYDLKIKWEDTQDIFGINFDESTDYQNMLYPLGTLLFTMKRNDELGWKPIFRPLSDLTKEIEHNEEKFIPMYKLIKTQGFSVGLPKSFELRFHPENNVAVITNGDWMLRYMGNENAFFLNALKDWNKKHQKSRRQLNMYQMLFEWHFDVFNLGAHNLCYYK